MLGCQLFIFSELQGPGGAAGYASRCRVHFKLILTKITFRHLAQRGINVSRKAICNDQISLSRNRRLRPADWPPWFTPGQYNGTICVTNRGRPEQNHLAESLLDKLVKRQALLTAREPSARKLPDTCLA